VAGRLWAAVVNDFHRQGEVTNDPNKIHGSKATVLGKARSPNPRIGCGSSDMRLPGSTRRASSVRTVTDR
jgi:hypothetical protein